MFAFDSDDNAAGVRCTRNATLGHECNNYGDIRLVGGESEKEGRVEFCTNGFWGAICDNTWTEEEALVACKQTGFQSKGKILL